MDRNLLKLILSDTDQVREAIIRHGELQGYNVQVGDLYVLYENPKATADICLVSHYDTVGNGHPQSAKNLILSTNGMLSTDGSSILGADDRAGVYLCMELSKYARYTLFCDEEEVGGYGAHDFCKHNPSFNCKAFIELDRKGDNDAVFYHEISPDFESYILSYGWTKARGTFSDISILTERYSIPSVNLSVGYKFQHTPHETLDLNVLDRTKERVKRMLLEFDNRDFQVNKVNTYTICLYVNDTLVYTITEEARSIEEALHQAGFLQWGKIEDLITHYKIVFSKNVYAEAIVEDDFFYDIVF